MKNSDKAGRTVTIDLLNIVRIYGRHKLKAISVTVFVLLLCVIYAFMATPLYRSVVSLYPQYPSNSSSSLGGGIQDLANMTGILGINLNSGTQVQYYIPDIVFSRTLRRNLATRKWNFLDTTVFKDLVSYWELDKPGFIQLKKPPPLAEARASQEDAAMELLLKRISVREEDSGLINIGVLLESPHLAAEISNYIAEYLKRIIAEHFLAQSSDFREFIEGRLASASNELALAESLLTDFRKYHLLAMDSAEDQLERGRLMRKVEIDQEIYLTLRQQYELARLEELKSTPILMILDPSERAYQPERPRKPMIILMGMIASVFCGILLAYFLDLRVQLRNEGSAAINEDPQDLPERVE